MTFFTAHKELERRKHKRPRDAAVSAFFHLIICSSSACSCFFPSLSCISSGETIIPFHSCRAPRAPHPFIGNTALSARYISLNGFIRTKFGARLIPTLASPSCANGKISTIAVAHWSRRNFFHDEKFGSYWFVHHNCQKHKALKEWLLFSALFIMIPSSQRCKGKRRYSSLRAPSQG